MGDQQAKARQAQKKAQFGDASIEQIINQMKAQYLNDLLHKSMPKEVRDKSDESQQQWIRNNEKRLKRRRSFFKKAREIEALVEDKMDEMIELRAMEVYNVGIITDVSGTMEAILEILKTYDMEKPKLNLIFSNVGDVSELDLENLKSSAGSFLYTFHHSLSSNTKQYCVENDITVCEHTVIYRLFDDIKEHLQQRMPKKYKKVEVGRAQIRQTFSPQGRPTVLGLELESGYISKQCGYRIYDKYEEEVLLEDDSIFSLRYKTSEESLIENGECGVCVSRNKKDTKNTFLNNTDVTGGYFVSTEFKFVQERLNWSPHF